MEQALTAHYNTSNYSSNWSHCKEFIPLWADAPHLDLQQQEPGLKIAATQCSQQPPGGPKFKWFHTLVFRALSSYRLKKEVLVAKYCLSLLCLSPLRQKSHFLWINSCFCLMNSPFFLSVFIHLLFLVYLSAFSFSHSWSGRLRVSVL